MFFDNLNEIETLLKSLLNGRTVSLLKKKALACKFKLEPFILDLQ